MAKDPKTTYIAWLADAHAMEMGLVRMLEKQSAETKDLPEVSARIQEHLEETRAHAARVEEALLRLGGDPSTGKDVMSQGISLVKGMVASMPSDALIKNMHASYAAEHFEIGAYTVIAAAAEAFGDTQTAEMCREIIAEEEDMAAFIYSQLPDLVTSHLGTEAVEMSR